MNVPLMKATADFLDKLPEEKFNMGHWGAHGNGYACPINANECGTTCCIAGWVLVNNGLCVGKAGDVYDALDSKGFGINYQGEASDLAADALWLDHDEAENLFYQRNWPTQFQSGEETATPQMAAARIRHMIETGE